MRIREMLKDGAAPEDIAGYLMDRNLPLDELSAIHLSEYIVNNPPNQGFLTISNALQWRLQYKRVIELENSVAGVINDDFK